MNYKKIAIGAVILLSAFALSGCKKKAATDSTTSSDTTTQTSTGPSAATVKATEAGFDPGTVTISAGQSITWTNDSKTTVQVGSADHPTHTKNPALTGGEFVIELKAGESKTVSAGSNVGTWGYHDHLNAKNFGRVVIE